MSEKRIDLGEVARLRGEVSLLRRADKLRRDNGIAFYRPHYKQDLFHSALAKNPQIRHRYVRAGNRFGKSDMNAAEIVAWLLGERTWYKNRFPVLRRWLGAGPIPVELQERSDIWLQEFPGLTLKPLVFINHIHEGHENHPYVRGGLPQFAVKILLIVQDWEKSTEIFTEESAEKPGKLFKFLPTSKLKSKRRNHSSAIDMVEATTGSRLHIDTIKSFKQDPLSMESSDWDFIIIDEPPPEAMFNAATRGLIDRSGSTSFGLTPLREPWINDRFIQNKAAREGVEKGGILAEGRHWMITGEIHDNPHLSREDIDDYFRGMSDAERACRERGLPLDRAGLIYKDFSWDAHVIYDPPHGWNNVWTPPKNYCVYYAIDWHPSVPHAVLFAAVAPTGHVILYAGLFDANDHTHEGLANRVKEILGKSFVAGALCDPLAWTEAPSTGTTNADDLMSYGLFLEKAVKDPRRGIPLVEAMLRKRDPKCKDKGMLLVADHLTRFLWEIDRYVWGEDGLPEKKQKFHFMENLYRLHIHEFLYIEPPEDVDSDTKIIPESSFERAEFDL